MSETKKSDNYLDRVPVITEGLRWNTEADGSVILVKEHRGLLNTIAHKIFRMPKETQVHLDEWGNFIWPLIDGHNTVYDIAERVKENFGEKAEPLYERLCKYFQMLEAEKFVVMR